MNSRWLKPLIFYFKVNDSRLRDGTVTAYRTGVDALIDFADGGLLTGKLLQDFADARLQARKLAQTSDDQGRAFVQTNKSRSLHSVNRELRTTRTVLEWLRVRGHVALTRDDIADALKRHKAKPTEAKPLFTPRLRELLAFCNKHEPQMKPFVVFLLLTGMRVGEATGVRFEQIDLAQSRTSLSADDTKTGHGRTVGINPPSPALHRLIESFPQKDGRVFAWTEGQLNDFKKRSWRKLGKRRPIVCDRARVIAARFATFTNWARSPRPKRWRDTVPRIARVREPRLNVLGRVVGGANGLHSRSSDPAHAIRVPERLMVLHACRGR